VDYCREVGGYPGLVVHAPLTATLMLDLACRYRDETRNSMLFAEFRQKSVSPLFHLDPFTIHLKDNGSSWEIWASNPGGSLAATATLLLAESSSS
jgi:3-methylfumaryl-CoA hydratase